MHIAIFTESFLPQINGVSTSIAMLARGLAQEGHKVLIVCPSYEEKETVHIQGVTILRQPSVPALVYPGMYLGTLSPQTIKNIRDFRPDIAHLMTPATIGIEGLGLAKAMKWPMVSTFHAYFMEPEYLQIAKINFGKQYLSKFLWTYARAFFDATHAIVCPTDFVKKDLIRHRFKKPLYVCSNGIEIDTRMKRKKELLRFLQRYDVDPAKTAMYIGRLSAEKSVQELIDCFELVLEKVPQAKLLIVGNGPLLDKLTSYVVEKKLSGKVIFTGEMKHIDILEIGIFKAASVFVSCSSSEVQPMSMIEATAFGLPMVAYKARGAGDMIAANGYAVRPNDTRAFARAVAKILQNKKLQQQFSKGALELAKRYEVSACAKEMISIYTKVIEDYS